MGVNVYREFYVSRVSKLKNETNPSYHGVKAPPTFSSFLIFSTSPTGARLLRVLFFIYLGTTPMR